MPDPKSAERIVLKVIAGAQAGAEVSLEPGEYGVGTGVDDDIQFIDVSMKPAHIRARLAPGKIEVRNGAGAFHVAGGLRTAAGDDEWQEVQPLDVITAGTTRLAFGPPTAQWATIADRGDLGVGGAGPRPPPKDVQKGLAAKTRSLAIPISLLILVLSVGASFLIAVDRGVILSSGSQAVNDVATLRAALDRFSFGRGIAVKQDVDGAIYVSGYVDTPVERRAIVGAIDATGVSVRLRLGVLQVFRTELDGLVRAEKVNVTYDLSSNGDLTLKGVILDAAAADRFVAEVAENVIGLNKIQSDIKTAKSLFEEIQQLAHLSDIDDAVVFRLDGSVIEANGVISVNKIDEWVGFLQAYSRRFGDEIGLRSYVQLQNDANTSVAQNQPIATIPILLGAVPAGQGIGLDINRLKSGDFKFAEAFAGAAPARGSRGSNKEASPPTHATPPPGAPSPPNELMAGPIATRRLDSPPIAAAPAVARVPLSAPSRAPAPLGPTKALAPLAPAKAKALAPLAPLNAPPPPRSTQVARANFRVQMGSASDADPKASGQDSTSGPLKTAAAGASSPEKDPSAPSKRKVASPLNKSAKGSVASATFAKTDPPDPPSDGQTVGRAALPATFRHDIGDISDRASSLMARWLGGNLVATGKDAGANKDSAIESALDTLANESLGLAAPPQSLSEASKELFAHKYLPLFALSRQSNVETARQCRRGSRLSLDDLPAALFWLDLMSTTNAITLRDFDINAQGFILEAALNPALVAECLRRDPSTTALIPSSIYLAEARRNPEFVRFVTQSLPPFSLDVTGASLWDPRFVQLRDGSKLREGEAPDAGSRIDTVGELGLSILLADGFADVIYNSDINWLAER